MGEKRFELLLPNAVINDTIVRKSYYLSEKEDVEKVVDLLNSMSEKLNKMSEKIKQFENSINDFTNTVNKFKEEW